MTQPNRNPDVRLPFWGHLAELRKRLLLSFCFLIAGFAVAYSYSERIFALLVIPFNEAYQAVFHRTPHMVTTTLTESFMVFLKVGLLGGLFLASPAIFFQIWRFISPGLRVSERRHVLPIVTLATLFFVGGALFGYFGVFPLGFRYFLETVPSSYVEPMIRMQDYFELASWMMLVFGLVFEMPLIALYLTFLGVLTAKSLLRPWRGIIVTISIVSAILTPADPLSMIMMAVPLLGLYGITILVALFLPKSRRRVSSA